MNVKDFKSQIYKISNFYIQIEKQRITIKFFQIFLHHSQANVTIYPTILAFSHLLLSEFYINQKREPIILQKQPSIPNQLYIKMTTNLPQQLVNALKTAKCQHCNRSFYKDNLEVYSLPCAHSTCRECSARKCKQCKDFDINRQHIDYALIGILESSNEVQLDQKSLQPKSLRTLFYVFLFWLLIIICLTITTLVTSHNHKTLQAQYISNTNSCLTLPISTIQIQPIDDSLTLTPSTLTIGRHHHGIHINTRHLHNMWRHFKEKFRKLGKVILRGLKLAGKVIEKLGKEVFHSVEQVVVDVSKNLVGDLGMVLLPEISESIVSLNMAENEITDLGLKNMNGRFPPALEMLNLHQNSITSAGLCGFGQSLNGFVSKAAQHIIKLDLNPIKQEFADLVKEGKKQFACTIGSEANNAFCNFAIDLGQHGQFLVKDLFKCT